MTQPLHAAPWRALVPGQLARKLSGLLGFAATQVAVQAIGFLVGIMLLRTLDVSDYAYYTLATSMVGIAHEMLILGLAFGVLALGGPLLHQPGNMARLVADVFAVHVRLAVFIVPLLAAAFASMFIYKRATATSAAMLTVLVVVGGLLQARNSLSLAVVRLHGDRLLQQKLDLSFNAGRALMFASLAVVGLNAPIAMLVNALAATAACAWLHHWLASRIGPLPVADGASRPALLAIVRRQAPNSLYYIFSGQVTIWLVGLLGSTQSLAEVGALGRLAVLFTIIGSVVAAIVQPYFARHGEPRTLVPAFVTVNVFFVLLTVSLWSGAVAFPGRILWILGGSYRGLQGAVPWLVLGSCLTAWHGAIYLIGAARGWLVPATWLIPAGMLAIAGSVAVLDVSTPTGACMMGCVTAGVAAVLTLWFVSRQLRDYSRGWIPGGAS